MFRGREGAATRILIGGRRSPGRRPGKTSTINRERPPRFEPCFLLGRFVLEFLMVSRLGYFIAFLFVIVGTGTAAELPKYRGIVDQRRFPDSINACAPAAALNLLKFSGEKHREVYRSLVGGDDGIRMRFFVDRYIKGRPSVVFPARDRWGVHGILSEDLVAGMNELLADTESRELNSRYLDRQEGESVANHLVRVHDLISASVKNGTMPVLSLRSFVVKHEPGEPPGWASAVHHNVTVVEVEAPSGEFGFRLVALDPYKGRRVDLLIHREANGQAFRALKGTEENCEWLDGQPFLQVLAPEVPTVRPNNLEWSQRYIVVANFLIGDF